MFTCGSLRGAVANVHICDIVISEFEHQSHYYLYFRTNTIGNDINPLIPPNHSLNSTTIFLYLDGFGIK